jgi:hypothetical protein
MFQIVVELFFRELAEELGLGGSINLADALNQFVLVHAGHPYRVF